MKHLFVFLMFLLPLCALSQVYEPFDNQEITANYPWQGNLDKFKTENGFLRLNAMGQNTDAMIILYGATLGENEWTFRVKSGYMTTKDNFFRVYLWCNTINFSDHYKAYFVEIGKGQRKIALCKTEGLGVTDTLTSRVINNLNDAFDLHIKVTTDTIGKISLYGRSDEKPDYTLIGTARYEQQITPGYFILYCNYSTEHAKDKYFGPVSIKNFNSTQPTAPVEESGQLSLLSVWQENASTLNLTFNHAVDPTYASFTLNSLGEVDDIYLAGDERQLRLVWNNTTMEKGKTYTLTYSDLYDNKGNVYRGTSQPFIATHSVPTLATPGSNFSANDIIISEVMANPKGAAGLPETEYVELHNTTQQNIDLNGWAFRYDDKSTNLTSIIPAEGYAVLYRSGREIQIDKDGLAIPLSTFPSALANTGKNLSLIYKENTIIDNIAYPEAKAGYSWERIGNTWKISTDSRGGTPGSTNSITSTNPIDENTNTNNIVVMPQEIVFSELLPEPQEGGSEYIELYNRSTRDLPLSNLSIALRKSDGSLNTNYPLSSIESPLGSGEYALLTKNADGVHDFFLVSSPDAIHELKLPILTNTTAQLVLFRSSDKEVIDEVHYNNNWHSASVKDKKGIALEKIDLNGSSQDPENWTSASTLSGGGTPGYKNSQSEKMSGATSTGIEAPEYTSAGNYAIAYHLDRSGYLCRASIYDMSGRRVAEVVNHELLGTEGIITWDGYASGSNKLVAGVYIFHAELYHPQGGSKNYKKVFLVR